MLQFPVDWSLYLEQTHKTHSDNLLHDKSLFTKSWLCCTSSPGNTFQRDKTDKAQIIPPN